MKIKFNLIVFFVTIIITTRVLLADQQDEFVHKPTKVLLVGVSYNNAKISGIEPLPGVQNDIILFEKFFSQKLGINADNITILSESVGKTNPNLIPTRKNIEREMIRLGKNATSNDSIFILFGGHGTRIPESTEWISHERDGLDSAFLPCDAELWNESTRENKNIIRDHEIGQWIDNIRRKNAFVWFVADFCHSGGTRGDNNNETPRRVTPAQLKIPESAFEITTQNKNNKPLPKYIEPNIYFGASQPHQPTFSLNLPTNIPDKQRVNHGMFSFYLCKTLENSIANNRQISYADLLKSVELQYGSIFMASAKPIPVADGTDLTLAIFRNQPVQDQLQIRYSPDEKRLNVGIFHGFNAGSIFEIFDNTEKEKKSFGYIQITNESLFSSIAKPIEWNGIKPTPPDKLPPRPLHANLIFTKTDNTFEIQIAFDANDSQIMSKVKQLLFSRNQNKTAFKFREVKVGESPDFLVRFTNDKRNAVAIDPVNSPLSILEHAEILQPLFDTNANEIIDRLEKLADIHCLLRIAERSELRSQTMHKAVYDKYEINVPKPVSINITQFKTEKQPELSVLETEKTTVNWIEKNMQTLPNKRQIELNSGESLAWIVENTGIQNGWLNIVAINGKGEIISMLNTQQQKDNNIAPHGKDRNKMAALMKFVAKEKNVECDLILLIITAEQFTVKPNDNQTMTADLLGKSLSNLSQIKKRGESVNGFFIIKAYSVITKK